MHELHPYRSITPVTTARLIQLAAVYFPARSFYGRLAFFPMWVWAPLCFAASSSHALLNGPTINRTHIVFSYAGDLWSVPRDGGSFMSLSLCLYAVVDSVVLS